MKRTLLLILAIFLLTTQAEEINSPLVHAEEYSSPTITFQTDETGVFAVVVLSTLSPDPLPSSEEMEIVEGTEELETKKPATFIISTRSTSRSLVYTLTPIKGENP